jgi:carboxypeptidase C (cathepsin A)
MSLQRIAQMFAALAIFAAQTAAAAQPPAGATPYTRVFTTRHTGVFNGQKATYVAVVGPTVLRDSAGQPTINMVSTAFVRSDVADPSRRPVIFVWGGGPSGPATGQEMHWLGPRLTTVAPIGEEKTFVPQLVDNPQSVLDVADLVFIDPAETGFTRVLAGGKRADFYSVDGDAQSIADFIFAWLKDNKRESSPRYILGQSYGSVRAIKVAIDLAKIRPADGVIVQGNSAMTLESNRVGTITSYALNLPTFAITAVTHGLVERGGRTDDQIVTEAYDFATSDYLAALARVQDLPSARKAEVAAKLSALTGIGVDQWLAHDLAFSPEEFRALVAKAKGAAPDHSDVRRNAAVPDPVDAAFARYMSQELGVTYPMSEYRSFAPNAETWYYGPPDRFSGNDWPGMLRDHLKANPKVRYLSINGLEDGIAVIGAVRYLFSRTPLPRDRIVEREYTGGHSSFLVEESRKAELADIRAFILKP